MPSFTRNGASQLPGHSSSMNLSQDLNPNPSRPPKELTCRHWLLQSGGCLGSDCPFSHRWTSQLSPPVAQTCKEWQKGTCSKRQDMCLYAHHHITTVPTGPKGTATPSSLEATAPKVAGTPTGPMAMQRPSKCVIITSSF